MNFSVDYGPNEGISFEAETDEQGYVSFGYYGNGGLGSDSLRVSLPVLVTGDSTEAYATVVWAETPPTDCNGNMVPDVCDISCARLQRGVRVLLRVQRRQRPGPGPTAVRMRQLPDDQ